MNRTRTMLAFALLGCGSVLADTITVAPGESIQTALDGSAPGDVVELAAGGSWEENLVMPGHALTLRGGVDLGGSGQPSCTIDGQLDRAITIVDNTEPVSFENLIITGQHIDNGGGVYIYRSNPSFSNCHFVNCHAGDGGSFDGGGAVYIYAQSSTHKPSFTGCVFEDNTATKGGAIGLRSASSPYQWSAPVTDCIFRNNTADSGGAIGTILVINLGVALERCSFVNNIAIGGSGHALSGMDSISTSLHSCSIVLDGVDRDTLTTGSYTDLGHNCLSVVWTDADGDLRPDDCDQCEGPEYDFDLNGWSDCAQIEHPDGTFTFSVDDGTQIQPALDFAYTGYAVELAAGSYTPPSGGLVPGNHTVTLRGAVDESGLPASTLTGPGRAIAISDNTESLSFENLIITGQHPDGGGGAYIYRSNPSFSNCHFVDCMVDGTDGFDGGGAAFIHGSSPVHVTTFEFCSFIGNSANRGGAIALRASPSIYTYSTVTRQCIFRDNAAAYGGAVCALYTSDHGIDIEQCLFFNNSASIEGSAVAYTSSISTFVGQSAFCGTEPIIVGSWQDLGDNCFSESCVDLDGDMIPDDCDEFVDEACSADMDEDGEVGILDLLKIIEFWGTSQGDLNGDGLTDVLDLLKAIEQWGTCL